MRMSRAFGKTLRDDPAEAELASHRLMLRAGMILPEHAAGVYSYMPLAWRSIRKIEEIIREEMDAAGRSRAAHVQAPASWRSGERSGSDAGIRPRHDAPDRPPRPPALRLAPTCEELLTNIVKANVQQLPRPARSSLYQIQTKFRDEPRPRAPV